MDYAAYIAAWQQAHLGAQHKITRDKYAYDVGASSTDELFSNTRDHMQHLRTHSGFLNRGGWFEGPKMIADWLWRWPFHFVIDDLLHLRNWTTFHHTLNIYRSRIEGTYFRGDQAPDRRVRPVPATRLSDINGIGLESQTPYLIINANLTNRGASRLGVTYAKQDEGMFRPEGHRRQWPFEFTRDFVGSDATGYIRSEGFGLPVKEVDRDAGIPANAVVDLGDLDESSFRLSDAVAASGAAFDSLYVGNWIDYWGVSEMIHLVGGTVLNLKLGLEVPNFARDYSGLLGSAWDYVRMFTFQRNPRWTDPGARWLYVTDGGHYENLGVLALLRRGTRCIVSIDAGMDPNSKFADLRVLRKRIEQDLGWQLAPAIPHQVSRSNHRLEVLDQGQTKAIILYLKASADPELQHMREVDLHQEEEARKHQIIQTWRFLSASIHTLVDGFTERHPDTLPYSQPVREWAESLSRRDASPPPETSDRVKNVRELRQLQASLAEQIRTAAEARQEATARLRERAKIEAFRKREGGNEADQVGAPPEKVAIVGPPAPFSIEQLQLELAQRQESIDRLKRRQRQVRDQLSFAKRDQGARKRFEDGVGAETLKVFSEFLKRARDEATVAEVHTDECMQALESVVKSAARRFGRIEYDLVNRDQLRKARKNRLDRIAAFTKTDRTFPHDSTLIQWYEWERFEAYRILGFQMAETYLEPLMPQSPEDLSWCSFPEDQ